jgi:hypothetical protein
MYAVDDILSYSILRMFTTSTQLYSIGLILCICIVLFLRYAYMSREGFILGFGKKQSKNTGSLESRYTALQDKLQTDMAPYCQMTKFAHDYMRKIFTMKTSAKDMVKPKPIPEDYAPEQKAAALKAQESASKKAETVGPPSDTPQQAERRILSVYKKVYACEDDMAASRPSCKQSILRRIQEKLLGRRYKSDEEFIPCTTYLNLPKWANDDTVTPSASLMLIPDTLAEQLNKELDWFEAMIVKLSNVADMAQSPPSSPPDTSETPDSDSSGKSYSADGFLDKGKCSPSDIQAARALLAKKKREGKARSCVIPPLEDELTRIENLFASEKLKAVLNRCGPMLKKMTDLKAVMDKLEKGVELSMPKKNYMEFPGGDRANALVFSIKQNQP